MTKIEPGDTNHIFIGPGKPYTIHILAIIDGDMIVYKWYGRHKQWWHYVIENEEILEIKINRAKEYKEKTK